MTTLDPGLTEAAPPAGMPTSATLRMYLVLLFGLSSVFWVAAALADDPSAGLPVNLPISAAMFVCPLLAAVAVVYRHRGVAGVRRFVRRALDHRRIRTIWYVPLILTMPAVTALAYAMLRGLGRPLPPVDMPLAALPAFAVAYLCSAACEQLGWTALATDLLLRRWDALTAALTVGVVWAVWHVIPYAQAGNDAGWIVWQCVFTVALRVVIVAAYVSTGRSVFAAIVVQATADVSWSLFPNFGSHYDPAVTGALLVLVAGAVTVGWGRTLAPAGPPEDTAHAHPHQPARRPVDRPCVR